MKKQFLLTRMLLLCALIIGSVSSAWGAAKTSTLTFAAKCNGSGTAEDGVVWTVTSDGTESTFDSGKGIHYGTSSGKVQYIKLTTSGISGTITKIVVNASTASGVSATASVTVGGSAFGGDEQSLSSTAANYTFTGSAAGEIIVTVTKPSKATKAIYVKSVAVTYDDGPAKTPHGMAWSAASKDVTYNTPYELPTLSNPHNLTVSYSSSNTTVATVVEGTGVVTINNVNGYTTITATTEGNETYAGGAVSYTLNVSKAVVDGEFDFSLSNYGSGIESTDDGNSYVTSESTWTSGNVTMKVTGKYRWWLNNKGVTDLRLYNNDPLSAAAFSVPDGYVITQIETSGGNFASIVEGDGTISTNTWTGASQNVKLAISTSTVTFNSIVVTYNPTATVSINSACTDGDKYYGTYSNSSSFIVPADLTVSAISVKDNKLTVTNYNEGDIVKANTGVMVSSTTAGDHTIVLSNETGTEISGNMLKASSVAMDGDNLFYRLTMHNGETIGFYWGAADGAAFDIDANKAYLAVSTATAARIAGFNLFEEEGEATAIEGVKTIGMDAPVFNLNGQRVNGNAKGLLIKNGKKFMNR